jgi:hypothetical protein
VHAGQGRRKRERARAGVALAGRALVVRREAMELLKGALVGLFAIGALVLTTGILMLALMPM